MHSDLKKLSDIAQKDSRLILGVMSGTSLDGLDLALCKVTQHGLDTQLEVKHFSSSAYQSDYYDIVKPLFANAKADLSDVCYANTWIAQKHASIINETLVKWGVNKCDVDLIASHGQTIFHAPCHSADCTTIDAADKQLLNSTLQIGDGDHIAKLTGCITLSDFRQKHVAAGGEGAPMVKYGDYLLFTDKSECRVLLNLGGIANLSVIPPNARFDSILSTDTGPANTLSDAVIQQQKSDQKFDEGGRIAASGKVFKPLLNKLLQHPFLALPSPKTTGQETFNITWLQSLTDAFTNTELSLADLLATLCEFTAINVCTVINKLVPSQQTLSVYASGGGVHNHHLISCIKRHLPNTNIYPMDKLGLDGDAKEAALFALLANECICGDRNTFANDSGIPNVSTGKISFPN